MTSITGIDDGRGARRRTRSGVGASGRRVDDGVGRRRRMGRGSCTRAVGVRRRTRRWWRRRRRRTRWTRRRWSR